jgi:Na+/H+ antiporter NhaD/arsenite permease-like protein
LFYPKERRRLIGILQAYLSISLDAAGLFRFLAFWAARKGGSSGHRLYFYLYAFFLLCGVVVGNVSTI